MSFFELDTYELLKQQTLSDIHAEGYILRHKKSGARIALILNDDDNKVFYIGFKTPPEDETGVPHIIEHTVLCGSQKYPVKDPFVELVKGSLNTFLNAMTYPDKTIYPIASYNDKDFKNLMDVYMDAVLHPNILKCQEIFKQEGWHYELEEKDAPITINGVVYNEMKGACSSPDELLQNEIYASLFPNNTYSKNSGGNPNHIPELTYEYYIDFYKKYYHPSNSYIYLYGDFDIKERLEWLDKEYLCNYELSEIDSEIAYEQPFEAVKEVTAKYPISSEDSEENGTYFAYNKVIETVLDKTLYQAFDILDYALVSAPGAPVRQALIDAGIGQDVYGSFESGIYQPVFSILAKNANANDKEKFVQIIEDTLRKIVAEGVNKNALLGAINSSEFKFREADYGHYSKGLLYGIQCLDSWLFDDNEPFMHLQCLDTFAFLKEQIGTGYFEDLIQKYLLDNTHGSIVMIEPEKGLNKKQEDELEAKLAEYKSSLSDEELEDLIKQTAYLREYQETPSSEEDLAKIPMLERKDMRKEAMPFTNIEETIAQIPVVRHDVFSNGIDYLTFMFDAKDIDMEDIPYLGFLRSVLGFVNTASYSYAELANTINIYTGGIGSGLSVYPSIKKKNDYKVFYEIRVKVLESNLKEALSIVKEILVSSKLEDTKRLGEIIAQIKSRLQTSLSSAGHIAASMRSMSYSSKYAYYQDAISGIVYYDAICEMETQIKKDPMVIVEKLRELVKRIFVQSRMMISFTGDTNAYLHAKDELKHFIGTLPMGTIATSECMFVPEQKNEGFTDASAIQYVARSGNFAEKGFSYTGTLRILKMILGYDYMWLNIRVKGGAYGCMCSFLRTGESYFVSYRDPNLGKTNEVYEDIPNYLRNFQVDERDMTKYIIGTFGSLDTPLYPEAKGSRSMTAYLEDITLEDVQKERDEILNAQSEDIRALADLVEAVLQEGSFCVIGNENAIRKEEHLFMNIRNLNAE